MGALHELYDRYRDRVEFLVVYIREAHPEDGWVLTMNREEQVAVHDPTSAAERGEVASTCLTRHAVRMPMVVDGVDDAAARAYGAWPDRLYLIGADGRVAYQGGEGPFGFKPEELGIAIARELETRAG